ncbi:hypothetical protein BU15DRAFT_69478, partial [Melanogaster broomeanus]
MSMLQNEALHQSKLQKQEVSNPDANQTASSQGITTRRVKTTGATRPPRITLPLPANSHLRLQFYGFPFSRIWLMDYARKYAPPEKLPRADEVDLVFFGLRCLRAFSGIICLGIEEARYDPRKISIPEDCLCEPGVVRVLCLCANDWESYSRRPIQASLDRLKKILGKEEESPRWWEDVHDP